VSDSRDQVTVHLDSPSLGLEVTVGALSRERAGGRSVVSFAYEPAWVAARDAFPLDPALLLHEGEQYPRELPGVFADSAPDRWGRTLLERREAQAARRESRDRRRLDDWDFLVGVNDQVRMGALRYERDGAFVDDEPFPVPPVTRLRELEQLAREAEEGAPAARGDEERWIAMLLAPGSSLGGARPKASFRDADGSLWIAKFPSREDRHDVGAWEFVASRLAAAAGIEVPEARLLDLGSSYRTYCARRFDRDPAGRRLYASAMSLTGRRDNEDASYLDIARAIANLVDPDAIEADLGELFRRVVFNVLIADRDDHLRNHGFLREPGGWRLAPAFDVNPSPDKLEHSLALDAAQHAPDLEAVLETAPLYRLGREAAAEIVAEVEVAVAGWRDEAQSAGLAREEIESMATVLDGGPQ
jgi:serine/threonine-protein kinase HipA